MSHAIASGGQEPASPASPATPAKSGKKVTKKARVAGEDSNRETDLTKLISLKIKWFNKVAKPGGWFQEIRLVQFEEIRMSQRLLAGYLHWEDITPLQFFYGEDAAAKAIIE